jgi:hypothetical protein
MLLRTESDSDGNFGFHDVPVGWYLLHASAQGFIDQRLDVEVRAGETTSAGTVRLFAICALSTNCDSLSGRRQNGVKISGRVVDQTGMEILYGSVSLYPEGSRDAAYGSEVRQGRFDVAVEPDEYTVAVAVRGFLNSVIEHVVAVGKEVELGAITMRISNCDTPGAMCDNFGQPEEGIIAASDAVLYPGCGIELTRKNPRCEQDSTKSDLKLEIAGDGAAYLLPANSSQISVCDSLQPPVDRIRIDHSRWGEGWCLRTHDGHNSRVFIKMDEVPTNAAKVAIWYVTRR